MFRYRCNCKAINMNISDFHNLGLCLVNEFGRNASSMLFGLCAGTGISVLFEVSKGCRQDLGT